MKWLMTFENNTPFPNMITIIDIKIDRSTISKLFITFLTYFESSIKTLVIWVPSSIQAVKLTACEILYVFQMGIFCVIVMHNTETYTVKFFCCPWFHYLGPWNFNFSCVEWLFSVKSTDLKGHNFKAIVV